MPQQLKTVTRIAGIWIIATVAYFLAKNCVRIVREMGLCER